MTASAQAKAKAQQYRQSEKGRMARRMYMMDPQVKARMQTRRQVRKSLGMTPIHRAHG